MTRIALTCVAVLVPVLSLPARAVSQALGLDVVSIATSHSLLGNRLTGAAVGAGFPARDEPFTVKLAAEFARGSSDRTAIVCAGLVAPAADGDVLTRRIQQDCTTWRDS